MDLLKEIGVFAGFMVFVTVILIGTRDPDELSIRWCRGSS